MEKSESSHYSPTLRDFDNHKELSQPECAVLDHTVWRKLDMSVLPVFACLFLFHSLDKGNIANAHVAGLQRSLAISNYQYTMALVATYVLAMVVQFPCNMVVKYIGPNLMLPAMITMGGFVSASQGLVHNYSEFLVCRSLLGLFQGGILPMMVLSLSFFCPPKLLQRRIAAFYSVSIFTHSLSSLLAAAIVRLDGVGGKPGWAWIFIVEGLFAITFGIMSFFLLPRSPEKVRFLTESERARVIATLAHSAGPATGDGKENNFRWAEVIRAVKSLHVLILAIAFFFNGTMQIGFVLFLPTIVAGLRHHDAGSQVQLMSAFPFAAAFVLVFTSVAVSDYYQRRGCIVIFFALLKMIGFSMYLASRSSLAGYVSLFFSVPGATSGMPTLTTWLVNNSAPHTRRGTAVALAFTLHELGGLFAVFLLGYLSTDRRHITATITFILMSVGMLFASSANWIYLRRENRLKAERRQKIRKVDESEGAGDRSAWFIYGL